MLSCCRKHASVLRKKNFGNLNAEKKFNAHGDNNSERSTILIRQSFACEIHKMYADSTGRFLFTEIKINDKILAICHIFAPTNDDQIFLIPFFSAK